MELWLLRAEIDALEYFIRMMEWLQFAPRIIKPMPESDITHMIRYHRESRADFTAQTNSLIQLESQVGLIIDNVTSLRENNTQYYTLYVALRELTGIRRAICRILRPWMDE